MSKVSINKLPDDCLIIIFSYLHDLDDLLVCSAVDERWKQIICVYRLVHVKYINFFDYNNLFRLKPKLSLDTVYFCRRDPIKETDLTHFFPNIKFLNMCSPLQVKLKTTTLANFLADAKNLKALVYFSWLFPKDIIERCLNLEMLATNHLNSCLLRYESGRKIRQLHLMGHRLDAFQYEAEFFPNLERLNIYNDDGRFEEMYSGPMLAKLKIIELSLTSENGMDEFYGFEFMNFCPALESAYLLIKSNKQIVSRSKVNFNMRDLVLSYGNGCTQEWSSLKTLLMRYPNLANLALRDNYRILDHHIEELIDLLPNLELLDCRNSDGITKKSLDFIQHLREKCGRKIDLYCCKNGRQMNIDYSYISYDKDYIVKEFNFMMHCFGKKFEDLPYLMGV